VADDDPERIWVYDTIRLAPAIVTRFADRIYQGESIDGAPNTKPFLVYRMGNSSPHNGLRQARQQYFTVYVHDEAAPGAYEENIDPAISELIDIFEAAQPAPTYHILEVRYLEHSSDQDDREMGTILRYVRFLIIKSEWT
jgi:hypothetical protein